MNESRLDPATEASIRELITSGDHRNALERAKVAHRSSGTAASEALLVDAYAERICSLLRRNLTVEAKSLIDLVRQRYPTARTRLDGLVAPVAAPRVSLDDLVRPLSQPDVAAERRAAIEQAIKRDVDDLAALARCEALAVDDPLRKAASALERAFAAVTSGAVAAELLALREVSHRSPLAPWKSLVRAIATFYGGDDEACRRHLDAIEPASAPARLVPAVQAMLGGEVATLTPGAAALRAQIIRPSGLKSALHALDQAFEAGRKGPILHAVRGAVQECRRSSPGQIDALKQRISVRCAMAGLDAPRVIAAMGDSSRHDAMFLRLFARGMEETRDPENILLACKSWEDFRQAAVQDGWFAGNGPEAAALALHMATLVGELPEQMLRDLQRSSRAETRAGGEKLAFLFPEELYRRACVLDPHPEAFEQWMAWASRHRGDQVERVARAWHKIRPRDTEPLLRLLKNAEERGALHAALGCVAKLEQIDPLQAAIRGTRLRLLAASVLRHIKQKKPPFAEADLIALAALPDTQEGDRPAFVAAVRVMLAEVRGRQEEIARARVELERLLGGTAAKLLLFVVTAMAKQGAIARLDPPNRLSKVERRGLPGAVARVCMLSADLKLKLELPWPWIAETARQFSHTRQLLGINQLIVLGDAALASGHTGLAYAASAAGLDRGGATVARFLLLRARSVVEDSTRHVVCAKAAAELARHAQDMELVEQSVELVRELFEFNEVTVTLAQARDVLDKEKAEPEPPSRGRRGPDYSTLLPQCQCAECRRARAEVVDPFVDPFNDEPDDDFNELDFPFELPPDIPPEVGAQLMREVQEAIRRGESFEHFKARVLGDALPRKRRKRGL
jgi:hypothetical protein